MPGRGRSVGYVKEMSKAAREGRAGGAWDVRSPTHVCNTYTSVGGTGAVQVGESAGKQKPWRHPLEFPSPSRSDYSAIAA